MYDPVCGMDVTGLKSKFCSPVCERRFRRDPKRFSGEPLIKLRNLRKTFDTGGVKTPVLRGIDLNVWAGDFVAIIGASGSGKSTCLNMIGLLERPTSGQIFLRGRDVSQLSEDERAEIRAKTYGFVFQQYHLIPWLNAYDNIALPLIFAGRLVDRGDLEKHFRELGLEERMDHRPFELSGGEQQRVAMLRAMANNPDIILGDEPTGNLDSVTGKKLLELLHHLNKDDKKTLVVVTHDEEVAAQADQVITLKDGLQIRNHGIHKIYTEKHHAA